MTALESSNPLKPNIGIIGVVEAGYWHAIQYEQKGMIIPFTTVSGVLEERALDTPTYAIDTTEENKETNGLFLVASGCLVDVERFGQQLEQTHAAGRQPDELSLAELTASGSVVPLTQGSTNRLPSQVIGQHVTASVGGQNASPSSKVIRKIEADLRPNGVHNAEKAVLFTAKMGIDATGIKVKDGVASGEMNAVGSPIKRAAARLNYALVPFETQAQMRKPLNGEDVIDRVRVMLAIKVAETAQK